MTRRLGAGGVWGMRGEHEARPVRVVCVCVCVCVCTKGRGKNNIKEGDPHGSRALWSPGAPPESVQRTVHAPPCPAPARVAAGGLAWVRTFGGAGASMPGRVMLHHSRPLRRGGGGRGAPVSS